LLVLGVVWPPETFISRKLERLAVAGLRVTVASLGDVGGRTPPAGVERVQLRDGLNQGRGGPFAVGRGAIVFLRLFCRSPERAVLAARAAARAPEAGGRAGWRAAAVRLGRYGRLLRLRPDVVHFEWTTTAVRFLSAVDALGCPFVVSSHGGDVQIVPYAPGGRPAVKAFPVVFRRAAAVHCVADAVVAETARFGLEPGKARVIRAGVDPGFFRPAAGHGDENGRFSLVSVGTLRWVKGFEYALLAVAALAAEGVPVELDILGGEPHWREEGERERLLATCSALGLTSRIRLHGRVLPDAVRDRLQSADVFVQSSLSEGHPTAVVEAMACGLPVVATDCGGTREALRDGVEGFLVAPRDWRAAAAALLRLWEEPALRARMGQAGRARVEAEFTLDRQTERFVALYEDVIRGAKR
jgi:glycosyltransferase involved in cell wall biosynthesis